MAYRDLARVVQTLGALRLVLRAGKTGQEQAREDGDDDNDDEQFDESERNSPRENEGKC